MPLQGDLLPLYIQFDKQTGKSALQYAILNKDEPISRQFGTSVKVSAIMRPDSHLFCSQGGYDKSSDNRNYSRQMTSSLKIDKWPKIAFLDRPKKLYLCALNFDLWHIRLT